MSEIVYRAQRLGKVYGLPNAAVRALADVSFEIRYGAFTAIIGPSGSGKSTLLNILGLLDGAYNGALGFCGDDAHTLNSRQRARLRNREIGFVFQSFQLLPRASARENVELPLLYAGCRTNIRRARADAALGKVGLERRADHLPSELSGGEQQRVAIARAIVNDPTVILADEPTGSLDSASGEAIMRLLTELNCRGTTVIVVTHNDDIASRAGQRITLKDGRLARAPA